MSLEAVGMPAKLRAVYSSNEKSFHPLQKFTDSVKHYLRGALYFNVEPNKDSLAPVLQFVKEDINVLIESFNWKEFN